jgi:hypothetical protein
MEWEHLLIFLTIDTVIANIKRAAVASITNANQSPFLVQQ